MWNFKYKNQYLNYVSDLMQDTAVQSMQFHLLSEHSRFLQAAAA